MKHSKNNNIFNKITKHCLLVNKILCKGNVLIPLERLVYLSITLPIHCELLMRQCNLNNVYNTPRHNCIPLSQFSEMTVIIIILGWRSSLLVNLIKTFLRYTPRVYILCPVMWWQYNDGLLCEKKKIHFIFSELLRLVWDLNYLWEISGEEFLIIFLQVVKIFKL